jgi:hypothetical protein
MGPKTSWYTFSDDWEGNFIGHVRGALFGVDNNQGTFRSGATSLLYPRIV